MPITLYDHAGHRNVWLDDTSDGGLAVAANQHLIIDGGEAMILDPGGHKVYGKVMAATASILGPVRLKHIFLSHQDPDIVAAINGWLMTHDAKAYISALWTRFVPHFGLDRLLLDRLVPIPDEGTRLKVGNSELLIVPAHFLHSCGNFQVYDPVGKVLYTGDLGASVDEEGTEVVDFDAHARRMEGFHRRYMQSSRALRAWARMVRPLDIEVIAPQHGLVMRGRPMVDRFLDWCEGLECGIDVMESTYQLPK